MAFEIARFRGALSDVSPVSRHGQVSQVVGLVIESDGPPCSVGQFCWLEVGDGVEVEAEVVGFRDGKVILMPLGPTTRIMPGTRVRPTGRPLEVPVGEGLVGRIVNGLGRPIDGLGELDTSDCRPVDQAPPPALDRPIINRVLPTGVRAVDALLTAGEGQRLGIFAGAGVGKSVLMAMMARFSAADVAVVGLIGERAREVAEFVSRDLGEDGRGRSVVVVATSDEPPLTRIRAAFTTLTIAESFRDQGKRVLLLFDSLTRVATAQREVGLSVGEPPTTRGYPPSAFTLLPRLLERAGTSAQGSITGFFTVLVEGDDLSEPVADAARSVLDGHIVLSRELAESGVFPAIDVGRSLSRLMRQIVDAEHLERAQEIRRLWSLYVDSQDLIRIGAYQRGSNPDVDRAVELRPRILDFLRQSEREEAAFGDTLSALGTVVA